MPINVKDALAAFSEIEAARNLPEGVVRDALAEAMEKAYRKHCELSDVQVKTVFDRNGNLSIFREREVVDNDQVEDDEFQISLDDARKTKPDAQIGDFVGEEIDFKDFDRADIVMAKSVMKQKIREAEKAVVYERFKDRVEDMVDGVVEQVEDKFALVRIGGTPEGDPLPGSTLAMMKKSAQIPTEHYYDGQRIKVVITSVDKESKGAIVCVSQSDPVFVRRLFEKEVPEIYNGIIEIKGVVRDPGARTKIAVCSHKENIDPIGACIGPKGTRVQNIISKLNGEKIDIIEWSDDIQQLIANALSPAKGVTVIPMDPIRNLFPPRRERYPRRDDGQETKRRELIAVVPDDQLSLAIGKKGQNAKLAVRLSGCHIDIKSQTELDELGVDYRGMAAKMHEEYEAKKAEERAYKQQQRIEDLKNAQDHYDINDIDFTYNDEGVAFDSLPGVETLASTQTEKPAAAEAEPASDAQEHAEPVKPEEKPAVKAEQPAPERELDEMEEAARIAKEKRKSLSERRSQYTSKLEPSTPTPAPAKPSVKVEQKAYNPLEKKPSTSRKSGFSAMQPIYTDEELAEIQEAEEEEEEKASWNDDVDYEEYDSYYDDEY